ncbi:MAG: hypothetical protein SCH98_18060, partial [Deferrisomatales bacterium]|nr:hypothetical protein [Deferrisomatales bacterium]
MSFAMMRSSWVVCGLLGLLGCAGTAVQPGGERGAEAPFVREAVVPPLRVEALEPDRPAPQAAVTTTIRWEAEVTGGVGGQVHTFRLRDPRGRESSVQEGPGPAWSWTPAEAGLFHVRAGVRDEQGNEAWGPWVPYEVAEPLVLSTPAPDRPGPRMATTPVRWEAAAIGGVGARVYSFYLREAEGPEALVQEGPDPAWEWAPAEAGVYRVRVAVRDALGNRAAAPWSVPFEVAPVLRVAPVSPDRPAPQAAVTTTIRWEA